jgi:hypothetical protein
MAAFFNNAVRFITNHAGQIVNRSATRFPRPREVARARAIERGRTIAMAIGRRADVVVPLGFIAHGLNGPSIDEIDIDDEEAVDEWIDRLENGEGTLYYDDKTYAYYYYDPRVEETKFWEDPFDITAGPSSQSMSSMSAPKKRASPKKKPAPVEYYAPVLPAPSKSKKPKFKPMPIVSKGSGRTTDDLEMLREASQKPITERGKRVKYATPEQIEQSNYHIDNALAELEQLKKSAFSKLFVAPARRREIFQEVYDRLNELRPNSGINVAKSAIQYRRRQGQTSSSRRGPNYGLLNAGLTMLNPLNMLR